MNTIEKFLDYGHGNGHGKCIFINELAPLSKYIKAFTLCAYLFNQDEIIRIGGLLQEYNIPFIIIIDGDISQYGAAMLYNGKDIEHEYETNLEKYKIFCEYAYSVISNTPKDRINELLLMNSV